jgi:hypothetical protein
MRIPANRWPALGALLLKPRRISKPAKREGDLFRATFENPEQEYFFVFRTRALRKIAETDTTGKEKSNLLATICEILSG